MGKASLWPEYRGNNGDEGWRDARSLPINRPFIESVAAGPRFPEATCARPLPSAPPLIIMPKHITVARVTARKRKRGGTRYPIASLDPPDEREVAVEDVHVWDLSTSSRTGRVLASKRTVLHHHQALSKLGEPPTSNQEEVSEVAGVEESETLATSENPSESRPQRKQKRPKPNKENDSVRVLPYPYLLTPRTYPHLQTGMARWLQYRSVFLDEFLRLEGLGDRLDVLMVCPDCSDALAQFRCKDCSGCIMRCSSCVVSFHRDLPLHRLQVRQPALDVPTCVHLTQVVEWWFF